MTIVRSTFNGQLAIGEGYDGDGHVCVADTDKDFPHENIEGCKRVASSGDPDP